MPIVEKGVKAERIELRVTAQQKALLASAAQVRHVSVSDFMLAHAIAAAEQAVTVPRVFYANEEGWAAIQQVLTDAESQGPSAETISWIKRHRQKD